MSIGADKFDFFLKSSTLFRELKLADLEQVRSRLFVHLLGAGAPRDSRSSLKCLFKERISPDALSSQFRKQTHVAC